MPKYELMYIIGASVSDDEIPKVTDEVKKFIEASGGLIEKHEDLGKKKLVYPIKKTRNGNYILDNFSAPSDKINDIEHLIRTNQSIIRHLIVNMDQALLQMEKDRVLQAKLKIRKPVEDVKLAEVRRGPQGRDGKKIQIDLDAEIEKALESKDLK